MVDSQRTSQEVPCRFRTAYDVELHPIHLAEAGLVADAAGRPRLRFRFEVVDGADLGRLLGGGLHPELLADQGG